MDRIKKLGETIRTLIEGEFNGYIKINFSQGSIGRVEKSEELDRNMMQVSADNRDSKEGKRRIGSGALTLKIGKVAILCSYVSIFTLCDCFFLF